MLREIRGLGFEYAELSHGIRISLLPGIIEAVDAGEAQISTLHNFCPLPIGVNQANPNLFQFSSVESRERENAWRYSIKTLDTAQRLKANLVVLHLGRIDMKEYTGRLIELAGEGQQQTPKYEKLCAEAIERREQRKERHLQLAGEMPRPAGSVWESKIARPWKRFRWKAISLCSSKNFAAQRSVTGTTPATPR